VGKQTRAVVTVALTKILENIPIRPIVPESTGAAAPTLAIRHENT